MLDALRQLLKRLAARLVRPGLAGVEERLARIEAHLARLDAPREKYDEELRFWRWLITTEEGRRKLNGPFEEVFGRWQRQRLVELGRCLGLEEEAALEAWCEGQSVVEIGAGPYPAVAAAPAWRRAVAVDPLARAYAREGLLPAACARVTYLEARGEDVPLPSGFADLVIIENALDHVSDPEAVVAEIRRLLRSGGLLWVLVDLSAHRDEMHPHPFDEGRIRRLLSDAGFEVVHDRVSDHKSHPKAYGEYRGLLRRTSGMPAVQVRPAAREGAEARG